VYEGRRRRPRSRRAPTVPRTTVPAGRPRRTVPVARPLTTAQVTDGIVGVTTYLLMRS
jgi:hypothetical protein